MKYLWLILLLGGCRAVVTTSPQAIAAQGHLEQIKVSASDALDHLNNAVTNLTAGQIDSARAQLAVASNSVRRIVPLVDRAKAETKKLSDERDELARHRNDLNDYQTAHKNDWLGPAARRWLRWICVVGALLGVGYVLLMVAGEMQGGALSGILLIAGHLFTFGLKFIGTLLGKAVAWMLRAFGGV